MDERQQVDKISKRQRKRKRGGEWVGLDGTTGGGVIRSTVISHRSSCITHCRYRYTL